MGKYCLVQHISSHSIHVGLNLLSQSIRAVDISGLGTGTRRRAYPHRQPLDTIIITCGIKVLLGRMI
ncbi:hypothetical protein GHT06_022169 [Daphnia sinensis]|uniref:Uncharacterized protein n=1 Tax=Daphnia sinensis TaxID=1820382 RepID=A0AAD5PNF8_9CRUS|nr:hypothetical protein GHT06_022169 [Daphnia sinensis]